MIRVDISGRDELQVGQQLTQPSVYLDHWALRTFSSDAGLASSFRTALLSKGGCLAVSWLNLAEFSQLAQSAGGQSAETFLDSLLPDLFFIEVNPYKVIERENQQMAGAQPSAPQADGEFAAQIVLSTERAVGPLSMSGFLATELASNLLQSFQSMADGIVETIRTTRQRSSDDPLLANAIGKVVIDANLQHGTRFLFRELARGIVIDKRMEITRNHAIDLLHAAVPCCYCDFVLLDKHWSEQVRRVTERLATRQAKFRFAKVYSQRKNGIERFLSDLGRFGDI